MDRKNAIREFCSCEYIVIGFYLNLNTLIGADQLTFTWRPLSPLITASVTGQRRPSSCKNWRSSWKIPSGCWCRKQIPGPAGPGIIFHGAHGSGRITGASTPLIAPSCMSALKKSGCSVRSHVQKIQPSKPYLHDSTCQSTNDCAAVKME